MKKRINTDLYRSYTIKDKSGNPVDLSFAYDMCLYVQRHGTQIRTKQDFSIKDNVVSFQYSSTENDHLGTFDIHFEWKIESINSENGFNQYHSDVSSDFEIVKSSEDEEYDDSTTVMTSSIWGQDGASAFEIWKSKYGTETSTLDDFFAWLREPLTSLQASYSNDGILTIKN